MYFHTDDPATVSFIANVAAIALQNGQRLRFDIDSEGRLKVKRGGGRWTHSISSTPDPYREPVVKARCYCTSLEVCTYCEV